MESGNGMQMSERERRANGGVLKRRGSTGGGDTMMMSSDIVSSSNHVNGTLGPSGAAHATELLSGSISADGKGSEGNSLSSEDDILISALVDSDEIPAIVRSAFEIESTTNASDESADSSSGAVFATSGSAQALLASLHRIVALKEREVAEITKLHYEDFVRSVDELRMVKRYSSELRRQVQSFNSTISSSGEDLLNTIENAAALLR